MKESRNVVTAVVLDECLNELLIETESDTENLLLLINIHHGTTIKQTPRSFLSTPLNCEEKLLSLVKLLWLTRVTFIAQLVL